MSCPDDKASLNRSVSKYKLRCLQDSKTMAAEGERTGATVDGAAGPTGLDPMGAEAVARGFARAILARDAGAAASYFSRAARILTPDDTEVSGRGQIIAVLEQVVAADTELEIRTGHSVVAEGVALCTQFWRRRTPGRRAGAFDSQTTARLVLTLREEGWRIMIASPWK
jgi:ketosteroid isomerase-like protein